MFPSLTGVIRFLIKTEKATVAFIEWVSVPYRGYSFFNSITGGIVDIIYLKCFRPLQGLFVF